MQSGAVYNTDSHALTMGATTVLFQRTVPQPDGPDLEMVVFDQVTITGVLVIEGTKPLLLVAVKNVSLPGDLIASAKVLAPGPGRHAAAPCADGKGDKGANATDPNAGAGGGGFGADGGNGETAAAVRAASRLPPRRGRSAAAAAAGRVATAPPGREQPILQGTTTPTAQVN